MSRINMANYYLVPGQHPGQELCQQIARNIVPEDGTMFLFSTAPDGARNGMELSDGSVQIIESPPFEVLSGYVLLGLVGRSKAAVLAQASWHIAGRDLAEHEIKFLSQAAVEGMRKSAALVVGSNESIEVAALLDELRTASGGLPSLLDKFRDLGDSGLTELRSLQDDSTYRAAAGVVLRVLDK